MTLHVGAASVTAIAVPTGYVIDDGANVALYAGNPLGFGKAVMLDRYDLVLLSSAGVPSGCTVTVNPAETMCPVSRFMVREIRRWRRRWTSCSQ